MMNASGDSVDAHGLGDGEEEETGAEDGSKPQRKRQQSFPRLLYTLLENEDATVVGWSADGKTFRIHQIAEFCHAVLPKYFRHAKLTSLQRQLNLYGFVHVTKGPLAGSYEHPDFARGQASSLELHKRHNAQPGGPHKPGIGRAGQPTGFAGPAAALWPFGAFGPMATASAAANAAAAASWAPPPPPGLEEPPAQGVKRPAAADGGGGESSKKARLGVAVSALEEAPWPLLATAYDATPFAPLAATLTARLGAAEALALCLALLGGVPNPPAAPAPHSAAPPSPSSSASAASAGAPPFLPPPAAPPAALVAPAKPAPAGKHAAPMAPGAMAGGPRAAPFMPSPPYMGHLMAAHYFQPHFAVQPTPIAPAPAAPGTQAPPPDRAAI